LVQCQLISINKLELSHQLFRETVPLKACIKLQASFKGFAEAIGLNGIIELERYNYTECIYRYSNCNNYNLDLQLLLSV
jgi:hypothetical protein